MANQIYLKKNLYSALLEIGLRENEIDLYTTSLAVGPATVASLAEYTGITRPNIYKIISTLEKHGLTNFSQRKKHSRKFVVEPPSVLLKKLREKKDEIVEITDKVTDLMPDLYSLYHQGENPTKIRLLKTEEEYISAVTQMLNETKFEICFFGSFDDFVSTVTLKIFEKFTDLRLNRNILSRTLILPSKYGVILKSKEKSENREIRVISNDLHFNTSFQLSLHSVIIWQPIGSLAILIQDEYIVAMFRSIFEMQWKQSE